MSRISLLQTFNQGLRGMLNVQSKLYDTQNQLATGKRVNQPSDDPVAAAKILQLEDELGRMAQYRKNIDGAENALMLEESQLDAITNLLTRVRELAVQAGNGTYSATERQALAAEAATRLDELLALANTRNTTGEYIFGGYKGENPPFVKQAGGFAYQGDEGQRLLQISSSTYVAMGHNGREVFMSIPPSRVPAAPVTPAAAAVTNSGDGAIALVEITDHNQYGQSPGAGGPFDVRVSGTAPDPVAFDIVDSAGNVLVEDQPWVAGGRFAFNGAVFEMSGTPGNNDQFRFLQTAATISAGEITDRARFEQTFSGPSAIYRVEILPAEATDPPEYRRYAVFHGDGVTPVLNDKGDPVLGSYREGDGFNFGGVEFTIANASEGEVFQLTTPPRQSVLDTVARLAEGLATLKDNPGDRQRLQTLVADTLDGLMAAESNVGVVRSQVGARLNTLESTRDMHEGSEVVSNKMMSEVRDLDYAEALTRLTMESTILQAAQQSFAKISKLSLFDFLR